MKLNGILKDQRHARPANLKPIEITVVGEDQAFKPVKAAGVKVKMLFVPEHERQELIVQAHAGLRKRFPDQVVPDKVVRDEEAYYVLSQALRDADPNADGVHEPFAANVEELRRALVLDEAVRVYTEYKIYELEEFPPKIPDAEFAQLVEDAKKNSVSAVLTSYGYEKLIVLARFLAAQSSR